MINQSSSLVIINNDESQNDLDSNFESIVINSFKLFKTIRDFPLDSILRSIAFCFVFVFVSIQYLIDILITFEFDLPEFVIAPIHVSPLFLINEQLQSITVKNLRKLQSFPKSYKKQDMINALLITN